MDIQNNHSEGKGIDIPLVGKACIHRYQNCEIVVHGRIQKLTVFVVFPTEKLGSVDIVVFWEQSTKLMRNVVVKQNPHTSAFLSVVNESRSASMNPCTRLGSISYCSRNASTV